MIREPNQVVIDLSALLHNLEQARMAASHGTRIMGVVKSDAYGHGILPVSRALEKAHVDYLGVAHLYEALLLRKEGIKVPIAILCGIQTREECCEVVENDLTPVIFHLNTAEILAQEAARRHKRIRVHVKIDTGMARLGISHHDAGPFIRAIKDLKHLHLEALTSHLASADDRLSDFTEIQIRHFRNAIETGRGMGLKLPLNNLANSAGLEGYKNAHFEMARLGIVLYGGVPSPGCTMPLKPVMHFKARILQIRDLPDQTPVSYGRTYYTAGPERIAILSAGYGDGLPRSMSNRGQVLIGRKFCPIIGRICMNLTISNVTGSESLTPGDEAVFLGTQGDLTITGDDIARWSGSISYEVFCSLGQRNRRTYLS